MKTKITHLLSLLLTLSLFLGIAPTVRTIELPNTLNDADNTDPPTLDFAFDESVEAQDGPLGVIGTPLAPSVTQSSAGDWYIEYVDSPKQFEYLTDRSLRLDDEGYPHIAYGGDHLYYTRYDGVQWHYEMVDDSYRVGKDAALALDGLNRPHISYYDDATDDLKYAWYNGTDWRVETVDSAGFVGAWPCQYTSLALDGANRPHIGYCTRYGSNLFDYSTRLMHAWFDGVDWHVETVDSGECRYASLTLEADGHLHIGYYYDGDIKHAWNDGTDWYTETVDSVNAEHYTSLALDGYGRPHISYINVWGGLVHAWHDGTSWQIDQVNGDRGYYTSLALDGEGRPYISYYDQGSENFKYAWNDGMDWHSETVDSVSGYGGGTSLALDGEGRPHIGYYDENDQDLKYGWHNGSDWQTETVDSSRTAGAYTSLVMDGDGRPHISYTDGDLKYARYDGVNWRIERVNGNAGWYTSLALDGASHFHISYYTGYPDYILKYAWNDGANWYSETVSSSKHMNFTSLALDEAGQPHISYQSGGLKYAWNDGADWYTETVDGGGAYTSLALDKLGQPHISYQNYDYPKYELRYAWSDGTDWYTETVDSDCSRCSYTSLVLDGTSRPHVSYYSGDRVQYAWKDGAVWHIETVDHVGYDGGYTSLALDGLGQPHISYCANYQNYDLKYAWRDGAVWHTEIVDGEGGAGQYTSLALDGAGQPHISYYDDGIGDLKYAWLESPLPSLSKRAMPNDGLRNNDTLTYTLTLFGPIWQARVWDPLPPMVHYIAGSITGTVTPTAIYSPTAHAVVWAGKVPTDTVQTIQFQVTPGITGTGSLSLSMPIVNTAWLTATESGMSVSATAIVNGYYVYLPQILRQF